MSDNGLSILRILCVFVPLVLFRYRDILSLPKSSCVCSRCMTVSDALAFTSSLATICTLSMLIGFLSLCFIFCMYASCRHPKVAFAYFPLQLQVVRWVRGIQQAQPRRVCHSSRASHCHMPLAFARSLLISPAPLSPQTAAHTLPCHHNLLISPICDSLSTSSLRGRALLERDQGWPRWLRRLWLDSGRSQVPFHKFFNHLQFLFWLLG